MNYDFNDMIKEEDEIELPELPEIHEKSIVKAFENTQDILRELGYFDNEDQNLPEGF